MEKKNLLRNTLASCMAGALLMGCSDDIVGPGNENGDTPSGGGSKYVIAGSSSAASYLLTTDRLDSGEASIVGDGKEVDSATTWLYFNNKYVYRLVYNQGNAGITTSYLIDSSGQLEERNIRHEIQNRFTTYGIYADYIVTAASGATDRKDSAGNPQYGVTFTLIDAEQQTLRTHTVVTENLTGTGEYCTLSGIVAVGEKIYSALCPEGVSLYGVRNNGHLLSEEARQLINEEGGISGSVTPDRVWVAIYNGIDFDNPKIITDSRLSYATSRYRSQYYPTIDADDEGNIYVFSASHASSQSGIQKTSLPSGVLRIKAGTEEFDTDYYVNLEDDNVAGRAMYKVWHIAGDYFLLQMYADKTDDKSHKVNTNRLGIFQASAQRFTWVNGLPDATAISSFSKNAYVEDGRAYIAVTGVDKNAHPTIYSIDPQTAFATPGLTVEADGGISAIGKLNY